MRGDPVGGDCDGEGDAGDIDKWPPEVAVSDTALHKSSAGEQARRMALMETANGGAL